MTPTLSGRIQTRFFLLFTIGLVWTAIITPVLVPLVAGASASMAADYPTVLWNAVQVLGWTFALGILWELLWHGLQQFRWEKDWPIMYALFQYIPEGVLLWFVVNPRWLGLTTDGGVPTSAFLVHFITTVLVTWTWVVGPHRIFFIRWRYQGGRFV